MYIVYKNELGYYVSYKNKSSDNYSDNWILAKKYQKIGPALNKICFDIPIPKYICDFDSFFKLNNYHGFRFTEVDRNSKLESLLLDIEENNRERCKNVLKTSRFGYIEKIVDNKLVDAYDDIYDYIEKILANNKKYKEKVLEENLKILDLKEEKVENLSPGDFLDFLD